jgi:uncharacterized protein (DUF1778 family)
MPMPGRESRTQKLDLRLTAAAKETLRAAALLVRRSLSEFVLESALERAHETLADRQRFGLDEERWRAFQAALDAPVRAMPAARKLLAEPGIFDPK